jgi:uncharacterized protein with LGFP repeats
MKHFELSEDFAKEFNKKKSFVISKIKNDYNDKFDSTTFDKFCIENSFNHEFSTPTLQPNEIVERKNNYLIKLENYA